MRPSAADNGEKLAWSAPVLRPLAADLKSVAGQVFAPGDGNSGSGKSPTPPGS